MNKPTADMTYPTYAVGDTDNDKEVTRVAAVTGLRSDQNQLEDLLRRIVSASGSDSRDIRYGKTVTTASEGATRWAARGCEHSSAADTGTDVVLFPRRTAPTATAASATVVTSEKRPFHRDWSDVMCFSCGKMGHAATHCPDFSDSFPFLQPGWQKEKTPGGFIMIPPWVTMDRRRAENGD